MPWYQKLTVQRLMGVVLFTLIFAMAVRVPTDTDTWWHIRSGEYIVDTRSVPTADPFSYTRADADWVDHSWGSQIVLYAAYDLFGGDVEPGDSGNIGLALYTAVLATAGMALIYTMCEGSTYLRAFVLVLGAASAAVFWSPRPQMFTFALGALVLSLISQYKYQKRDALWWIPLIMIVWANLHGGWAVGFIFLLGTIAGEVLNNLFSPQEPNVVSWVRLKKLILVTLVSVPAVILNPWGIEMLGYPFRTVGIGVLQDFIQEWASPNFHQPQTWPFLALLLGVLSFAGLSPRRLDWTDLVLVTGTAYMALSAGRNIALFAIAATPVLSRHVHAWLEARGWEVRPVRRVSRRQAILNWCLLGLVVMGAAAKIGSALSGDVMREAQQEMLPVEIAAFLDANPPNGNLFNSYNWGGYLMFAAPHIPVYVDGRTDLYDDAFLREYLKVAFADEGWERALEEQRIDAVAIEAEGTLAKLLRTQPDTWHEQRFDDGRSSLFLRTGTGAAQ